MANFRFGHGVPNRIHEFSPRMLHNLIETVRNATQQATSVPSLESDQGLDVPEIDGSHAAFVGLMVGLSAIIVICCGLVYYLLRNYPRDPARGLYKKPGSKDTQTLEQLKNDFDSDSEDDDIEKNLSHRGDIEKRGAENKPPTLDQMQTDDDSFDPEKIQASLQIK